jgi:hypothetical protein
MTRIAYCRLLLPLLLAGCSDPTAIEKFAQSSPPAAQFHALILDYPGLIAQNAYLGGMTSNTRGAGDESRRIVQYCAGIDVLDKLHAAMVAYMHMLEVAATAGIAPASKQSSTADASAGTRADLAPPAVVSPGPPDRGETCPPAIMPVSTTQALSASAALGGPAPAAGMAVTAQGISTDLQKLAEQDGQLHITAADANAAGDLVLLVQDAVTTYLREQAVRNLLDQGHEPFIQAVGIETQVIRIVQQKAASTAQSVSSDLQSGAASVMRKDAASKQAGQLLGTLLLLDIADGRLTTPGDDQEIAAAAGAYLVALTRLQQAFEAIYSRSSSGEPVLTAASWKQIQPLISDVEQAYSALGKL